jgi:LPS-assembly protein
MGLSIGISADGLPSSLWVHQDDLVLEGTNIPAHCEGAYREPKLSLATDGRLIDGHIQARADSVVYREQGDSVLTGNVRLAERERRVHTELAILGGQADRVSIPDGATFFEPGIVIEAVRGEMNLTDDRAVMEGTEFVLFEPEIRGRADRIERIGNKLVFEGASLTRCQPDREVWVFRAKSLEMNKDAVFATAHKAKVEVFGIPVVAVPRFRFPSREARVSGFLFPTIGYGSDDGVDIGAPYYANLAPNYDATLTPRIMTERGVEAAVELRHKSRWTESRINASILPSDNQYNGRWTREDFFRNGITQTFDSADRWMLGVNHEGRLGRLRTHIDYAAVSDMDYFSDLGTDIEFTSRYALERRAELGYLGNNLTAWLRLHRFQLLETRAQPYERKPEFEVSYSRRLGPLGLSLDATWARFDLDHRTDQLDARIRGDRFHLEPEIRFPMTRAWGFLNFTGRMRHTRYDLRGVRPESETRKDRTLGMATADAGLMFDRRTRFRGNDVMQTIEPRLFYLYQEYENQDDLPRFDSGPLAFRYTQLFRSNRYAGLDRIVDANQLAVGITSRVMGNRDGREYARFNIGSIVHFSDRRTTLWGEPSTYESAATSEIVGSSRIQISSRASASAHAVWDPSEDAVGEAGFSFDFHRNSRQVYHLSYRRYVPQDIEQTDLGVYWRLSRHWSVFGRWNRDWRYGRNVDSFAGLEYANCCVQIRAMWRNYVVVRDNRPFDNAQLEQGVLLQMVFKGLAGFGGRLESLLSNGIRGYGKENGEDDGMFF